MDKYRRYYGVMIFGAAVIILLFGMFKLIAPKVTEMNDLKADIEKKQKQLTDMKFMTN